MNKNVFDDIETCINRLLENPDSTLEDFDRISTVLSNLKTEMLSTMESLAGVGKHLSETQRLLLELVVDEFNLIALPKLHNLEKVLESSTRKYKTNFITIH